jgi:hypothetical protein
VADQSITVLASDPFPKGFGYNVTGLTCDENHLSPGTEHISASADRPVNIGIDSGPENYPITQFQLPLAVAPAKGSFV